MKQVHISLDSALRDIFAFEEAKAVFDKFLPGMRAQVENQPAACGFSARKLIGYSGGAVPAEVAGALDAALSALEVYSDEPDIADTPLTAGCRITPLTPSWPTFWSAAPRTALSRSATRPRRRRCSL